MLTRVEIDGFKSLQDFAVDLEPFTVFIGPNSAGKSNVLEALALLSRLATMPIAEAFRHGRGRSSDQFTRVGPDGASVKRMRFALEFLLRDWMGPAPPASWPYSCNRLRYELVIERVALASGAERLVACRERLDAIPRDEDRWIAAHPAFAEFVSTSGLGADTLLIEQRVDSSTERTGEPGETSWSTGLSTWTEPSHVVSSLRENLKRFRFLRTDAARLGEASDRLDTGTLSADGSNLPSVLAQMPPQTLGEIRADLVALVPGIASFDIVPEGEVFRMDLEFSGGERMPARLVSDGTLRALFLLTALRLRPRPTFLGVEEPENGIYPGRLHALLDLLLEETTRSEEDEPPARSKLRDRLPTQILVATHSPVILAALRKHPQHLRFIDVVRRDGRRVTRVRCVGPSAEKGRATVSLREIDQILQSAQSEEP